MNSQHTQGREDEFAAGEGLELAKLPAPGDIDAAWCLRFLRAIRDVSFATVDAQGHPSVRVIDVMMVTKDRLYFLAPRGKNFHADLARERYVAIVGQTADWRTCRLRGPIEHPDSEAEQRRLVDRIFELNPSMNDLYPGDRRYICDVFYLAEGEGEYFDLGQSPIFRKGFTLGNSRDESAGTFRIGEGCIGCGVCASVCPESCIHAGQPHEIDQSHCLRCGLCYENCPVQAVTKR